MNEKHILKQVGKLYKEKANEGRRWKEPSDWNGVWRNGRTGPWALRMRGVWEGREGVVWGDVVLGERKGH